MAKIAASILPGQTTRIELRRFAAGRCRVHRCINHLAGMRGYTVLELLIVMMLAGIVMAIAVPRAQHQLDRVVVQSARSDVRRILSYARSLALAARARVVVSIDSTTGTVRVRHMGMDAISRGIGHAHGVRLTSSRDSLVYDSHGMGHGAANLSVVVRKRAAAETVFVSRLGRVR
jgi:prepilin-type N-terminal cleavage/methylation domain-containing protein